MWEFLPALWIFHYVDVFVAQNKYAKKIIIEGKIYYTTLHKEKAV